MAVSVLVLFVLFVFVFVLVFVLTHSGLCCVLNVVLGFTFVWKAHLCLDRCKINFKRVK